MSSKKVRYVKDNESYEVESIINHKLENNNDVFLVKWKGYSEKYNNWIKVENFNETDMLEGYIKYNRIPYTV